MPNEFVEFFERAFIKQKVDALPCAELALLVFAFAAFRAAASFSFYIEPAKVFEAIRMLSQIGHGLRDTAIF